MTPEQREQMLFHKLDRISGALNAIAMIMALWGFGWLLFAS